MDAIIRRAHPRDIIGMYEAHVTATQRTLAGDYAPEVIEAMVKRKTPDGYLPMIAQDVVLVAVIHDRVVGFAHTVPYTLVGLYVHPDFQGFGIGTALLREAEADLIAAGATTITLRSTLTARTFYERHGYLNDGPGDILRPDGIRIAFYEMRKVIDRHSPHVAAR